MSPSPPDCLILDQRGHVCPAPIIALARHILEINIGDVLVLLADDPAAEIDVPAWCAMRGQELLGSAPVPGAAQARAYSVRRSAQSGAGTASAADNRER